MRNPVKVRTNLLLECKKALVGSEEKKGGPCFQPSFFLAPLPVLTLSVRSGIRLNEVVRKIIPLECALKHVMRNMAKKQTNENKHPNKYKVNKNMPPHTHTKKNSPEKKVKKKKNRKKLQSPQEE